MWKQTRRYKYNLSGFFLKLFIEWTNTDRHLWRFILQRQNPEAVVAVTPIFVNAALALISLLSRSGKHRNGSCAWFKESIFRRKRPDISEVRIINSKEMLQTRLHIHLFAWRLLESQGTKPERMEACSQTPLLKPHTTSDKPAELADLNGNQWALSWFTTGRYVSKAITGQVVVRRYLHHCWTRYLTGQKIQIQGAFAPTWNTLIQNKFYTVEKIDADTF